MAMSVRFRLWFEALDQARRPRWAGFALGLLAVLAWPSALGAAPSEACAVVEATEQAPRPEAQSVEQAPREAMPLSPEQHRPPEEAEVAQLGRVLKGLADDKTSAETLAALNEGRPFGLARLTILIGDARSLMAEVHARELRAQIAANARLKSEARRKLEAGLTLMEACAPRRFLDRGGDAAYRRSVALVKKYRAQLEPHVFERSAWREQVPRAASPVSGEGH